MFSLHARHPALPRGILANSALVVAQAVLLEPSEGETLLEGGAPHPGEAARVLGAVHLGVALHEARVRRRQRHDPVEVLLPGHNCGAEDLEALAEPRGELVDHFPDGAAGDAEHLRPGAAARAVLVPGPGQRPVPAVDPQARLAEVGRPGHLAARHGLPRERLLPAQAGPGATVAEEGAEDDGRRSRRCAVQLRACGPLPPPGPLQHARSRRQLQVLPLDLQARLVQDGRVEGVPRQGPRRVLPLLLRLPHADGVGQHHVGHARFVDLRQRLGLRGLLAALGEVVSCEHAPVLRDPDVAHAEQVNRLVVLSAVEEEVAPGEVDGVHDPRHLLHDHGVPPHPRQERHGIEGLPVDVVHQLEAQHGGQILLDECLHLVVTSGGIPHVHQMLSHAGTQLLGHVPPR
mmetsp:Transcript_96885/g.255867  ORF Transcript_96885/g.255867 Transcript_96885/m.255867 type:complete len:403 (+) Transcript_96885:406-1614(+)